MMGKNMVEIEYLIREIEKRKRSGYEYFYMADGLDDPSVLAQLTQRLVGEQAGYDQIIYMLRNLQGSDAE